MPLGDHDSDAGVLLRKAAACLQISDAVGAATASLAALTLDPRQQRAWFIQGTALRRLGHPAAAAAALRTAVSADPHHAEAHLNLCNTLLDLDDVAGAEAECRAALTLAPGLAEAHATLGHILCGRQRYAEAIVACRAAIHLRPTLAEAQWNLGIAALLSGDLPTGWAQYEWRRRHPEFAGDFRRLPTPQWHGEPLQGRTLLVTAEQGLGDTIQFARYLPLLRDAGASIVLACAEPLIPLLDGLVRCVPKAAPPPPHDLWVDQMSLPGLFATTLDNIPAAAGYLRADLARVAVWRRRLPAGRLIGLVWAGNPAHSNDRRRSLPPDVVPSLRPPAGATFVSLQLGPRRGEGASIPGLLDVAQQLADYAETAALLTCLDLLISVDTSVVHLAGALGRPARVLLPYAPDWRWLTGRNDTPWYHSLTLFRQVTPDDWSAPLEQLAIV